MSEWRQISEFPDYKVSERGDVMRVNGGQGAVLGKILTWHTQTATGYANVRLRKDGASVGVNVHKLVSRAFLGAMPEGLQVRHLDGCKLNNHFSNLKYGTASENAQDKVSHGRSMYGVRNSHAKIDFETAEQIRMLLGKGIGAKSIAKMCSLSESTVFRIGSGVYWKPEREKSSARAMDRAAA